MNIIMCTYISTILHIFVTADNFYYWYIKHVLLIVFKELYWWNSSPYYIHVFSLNLSCEGWVGVMYNIWQHFMYTGKPLTLRIR